MPLSTIKFALCLLKRVSDLRDMDMNKVIAWGLVIMGILSIVGWIAYSIINGSSSGTEIPIAITSGLTGVLTGKNLSRKEETHGKDFH